MGIGFSDRDNRVDTDFDSVKGHKTMQHYGKKVYIIERKNKVTGFTERIQYTGSLKNNSDIVEVYLTHWDIWYSRRCGILKEEGK